MNQIKQIRVNKGFSQEGLATISGISLRTIQRLENGEAQPRIQTLQTLATALEVEIDQLTGNLTETKPELSDLKPIYRKYTLLNAGSYLLFPLAAMVVIGIMWMNQEDKYVKKYLSMLLGFDFIAFSFNVLIAAFFKLNGWPGMLETAIILHLLLPLVLLGLGFVLITNRKN